MAAAKAHAKTEALVTDIKSTLRGIHGAGETLRGSSMQALDGILHKSDGEARNKATAEHGIAEMEPGRERVKQVHGEHAHSRGAGARHRAGSHFAKDRVHDRQFHQSGVIDSVAMGAAREATMEGHKRQH